MAKRRRTFGQRASRATRVVYARASGAGRRAGAALRGAGQATYAAITGDMGVQLLSGISEVFGATVSIALQLATERTETSADDTTLRILGPAAGNLGRWASGRWLGRKHPALSKVSEAMFSAFNGDRWGQEGRRRLATATRAATGGR